MGVHLLLVSLLFSIVDISKQSDLFIHDIPVPPGDPVRSMDQCLPWQYRSNASEKCECGHSLESIVLCGNEPYDLQLHDCYCMTQTNKKDQIIVGSCQYTCRRSQNGYYFDVTANTSSKINMLMCGRYNRQGQLCGSCIPGYAHQSTLLPLLCQLYHSNWAKYAFSQSMFFCHCHHIQNQCYIPKTQWIDSLFTTIMLSIDYEDCG